MTALLLAVAWVLVLVYVPVSVGVWLKLSIVTAAAEPAIVAALLGAIPTLKLVTKGVVNKNAIDPLMWLNLMVDFLKFENF